SLLERTRDLNCPWKTIELPLKNNCAARPYSADLVYLPNFLLGLSFLYCFFSFFFLFVKKCVWTFVWVLIRTGIYITQKNDVVEVLDFVVDQHHSNNNSSAYDVHHIGHTEITIGQP
ncbi:hypothetical protein ACJX0J_013351, partial [Zea mays]